MTQRRVQTGSARNPARILCALGCSEHPKQEIKPSKDYVNVCFRGSMSHADLAVAAGVLIIRHQTFSNRTILALKVLMPCFLNASDTCALSPAPSSRTNTPTPYL